MSFLDGQRVLLVMPSFFGYERDIKCELEQQGATVDWLPDRPYDTPVMKALTKLSPGLVQLATDRLYERLLEEFDAKHYDIVLVVNGQVLSKRMLQRLHTSFPAAQYVLYMWDSLANRNNIRNNFSLFDRIYTFDPQDAARYQLRFRPLFYSRNFKVVPEAHSMRYHISFVGTAHSDRFAVIDRVRKQLPEEICAYWYLYLQAPWVLQIYRWIKPNMRHARYQDFHFTPLDRQTVQSVFAESRAILDIEHPRQIGLTMRTFEALGAGKKLVTTNMNVRNYDFYSEDNVCVIDRADPRIPARFLDTPFTALPESIRRRYSIEGWLEELLQKSD